MYSKIESRFWQDEKVRALSPNAKYVFLYLLTSPHRNMLGLYFLPVQYAAFDLGVSPEQFKEGLRELERAGLAKYDEATSTVFIKNFLKYNPIENPNQAKKAAKKLQEIPKTPLLVDLHNSVSEQQRTHCLVILEELAKQIQELRDGSDMLTETVSERLQEPFRNGYPNRSETVPETVPERLQEPFANRSETVPQTLPQTVPERLPKPETETETVTETEKEYITTTTTVTVTETVPETVPGTVTQTVPETVPRAGGCGGGCGGTIIPLYEQEIGRPITPIEAENLLSLEEEYSPDLVREALRRAVAAGVRNIRYIEGILRRWRDAGVRSLVDVELYDKEAEKTRAEVAASKNKVVTVDLEKRKKELERKLEACLLNIRVNCGEFPREEDIRRIAAEYAEEIVPLALEEIRKGGELWRKTAKFVAS